MQKWRWMTIVAILCTIGGAIFYRPFATPMLQSIGDIYILAGFWAMLVAMFYGRTYSISRWTVTSSSTATRTIHSVPIGIALLMLYLVGERNITWWRELPAWLSAITIDGQMILFCMGVMLMFIGLTGVRRADFRIGQIFRQREAQLLIGATIIGFIIRSWDNINTVRAFIDEGPFILAIRTMREYPDETGLLQPIHFINSFSYLYSSIQRIFSDVFGSGLGVFRLTSALFGALTIPAVYWLARELFDRPTAWIATLFIMTFPPHIHFSRIGMNNIADPLFGVLALASLIHAIKHPIGARYIASDEKNLRLYGRASARPSGDEKIENGKNEDGISTVHTNNSPKNIPAMPYYAFSGMMLGCLPYFYEGGELLYPALIGIWLFIITIFTPHKPSWRGVLWLIIGFIAISFPNYMMVAGNGLPLFSRASANQLPDDFWSQFLINENGISRLAG
ncbi:MAG: glycosyltransferase family 39 protein, partial [Anaerolineae bacterium]|nr:glycosyltransferase family 39 protein [Anaerolineae bacterium]